MVGEEEEKPPSPAAGVQVQVRAELLLFCLCHSSPLHSNFWSQTFFCAAFFSFSLSRALMTQLNEGGERGTRRGGEKFLTCLACLEL